MDIKRRSASIYRSKEGLDPWRAEMQETAELPDYPMVLAIIQNALVKWTLAVLLHRRKIVLIICSHRAKDVGRVALLQDKG